MKIKGIFALCANILSGVYRQFFHKRNIIIVSEHKVKHVPIGGALQLTLLVAFLSGICWASYYTGNYYAVNHAFKKQSLALKSVVNDKVESNFALHPAEETTSSIAGPQTALASVNSAELFSRIAELENRLKASEASKQEFIEKVQQKTSKNIDSFQNLIQQTGLDIGILKDQVSSEKTADVKPSVKISDRQGGPYIPDSVGVVSNQENEVISSLDEVAVLQQIVDSLPLRAPVRDYQEMSRFGRRIDPFTGSLAFHSGIDLAAQSDTKIYATADGKVAFAARDGAYGNMVEVNHGFNIATRYAHLSQILVEDGQSVKRGQVIGVQGSTGRSTGSHVHYEVRYRNQPMDPRNFLTAGRYVPKS